MQLEILQALFDFGLFVLIWLVQLVIYPSFRYAQKTKLIEWHRIYTQRISYLVIPLMLGQLLLAIFQFTNRISGVNTTVLVLILFQWAITLFYFAPQHRSISRGNFDLNSLHRLVKINWVRTAVWTLIFILSLKRIHLL